MRAEAGNIESTVCETTLQAYLLGLVSFESALTLERRLAFQVAEARTESAIILCEHAPIITVGRTGSRTHIRYEPDELLLRKWPVRWVNRGGGCILHLPGQIAIYPIVALDRIGLSVQAYLERLATVIIDVLDDFQVGARYSPNGSVLIGSRPIARLGVAVRDWVSYYGAVLSVSPDLSLLRRIDGWEPAENSMTSLERERRGPLRPGLVRERLVEHFASRFGLSRISVFFEHPWLSRKAPTDAIAASS
jgi:lipoyl(octanoyl) transferase